MHFLGTFLTSLLLTPLATAAQANVDRFASSISKTYPIKLDDAKFSAITSAPRDYAVLVLLTAMERKFGCQACVDFQPDWDVLARSWQRGDKKGESRLVFATLDFVDGKESFVALGLQHAPVVMLYPPTAGLNAKASAAPIRYEFSS
jgi:oligosaccharyltransferase complex subunit gamma